MTWLAKRVRFRLPYSNRVIDVRLGSCRSDLAALRKAFEERKGRVEKSPEGREEEAMTEYREIPILQLRESVNNPRKHFGQAEMDDLVASVRQVGVVEPLVARPVNGHFEILSGHRRFRAAMTAGLEQVPVRVRECSDKEALEILLIANLQREDVHPLEEAQGFRQLIDSAGYSAVQVAERVGKSREYVYGRLKLLELSPEAQAKFAAGEISAGHAVLIARLPAEDQAGFIEQAVEERMSVRDLAEEISYDKGRRLDRAPFGMDEELQGIRLCSGCVDRHEDVCLRRVCFDAKVEAVIAAKVADGFVRVAGEWTAKELEGVLPRSAVTAFPDDDCGYVVNAVLVGGRRSGETVSICVAPDCPVHGRGEEAEEAAEDPLVRHERVKAERAAQEKERALTVAAQEKERALTVKARQWALDRMLDGDWDRAFGGDVLFSELLVVEMARTGAWPRSKVQAVNARFQVLEQSPVPAGHEFAKALAEAVPVWPGYDKARLALQMMLDVYVDVGYWKPEIDLLERLARAKGLDLAAIREALAEGRDPGAPAKARKKGGKK